MSRYAMPLLAVAVTSACASYSARSVPILTPTSYPHREVVQGITIVADPYETEAKYQTVFDTAPSYERGYLGINLLIFNDGKSDVSVNPANVACLATDGTELSTIPATQVAEQVLRSTTGRYLAGGIIAAGSSRGANDRIRADFAAKELKLGSVPPGGRSQGFVFCPNEREIQRLVVRGVQDQNVTINLPAGLPTFVQ